MTTPRETGTQANAQSGGMQSWVTPSLPAQPLSDPQEAAKWSRLRLRHFTPSGCGVDLPVGAAASSLAVVFVRAEPNTNYGISLLTSWGTTVHVPAADKSTTGFTARFGTNAPGGGGFLSWSTYRSEDS